MSGVLAGRAPIDSRTKSNPARKLVDIVSKVDIQEIRNAIDQALKRDSASAST